MGKGYRNLIGRTSDIFFLQADKKASPKSIDFHFKIDYQKGSNK